VRIPGPLLPARFLERPNRFLALVDLDGETVEAHLPDPGRLKELLVSGSELWVRPAAGGGRRTRYTVALVRAPSGELISLVTTLSNQLVQEALDEGRISELADWQVLAKEHTWGRSRFDFLLGAGACRRMLLEVKSVSLVESGRAMFPDAVTARGTRHLRELADALSTGIGAALLFVVQRREATCVTAARAIDPAFADAMGAAAKAGVQLLAYRSRATLQDAKITEPITVCLDA
jgi:sugar fermentation stimulation protein A